MNDLRHLGQRIRDLRTERGWSQEEFADVCGVHRTYMGHLERGEKNVSFSSILRLANALNVPLSELFSGIGSGEHTIKIKPVGAAPGRPINQRESSRSEVLKEIAALEKSVRRLKVLATAKPEELALSARTKRTKSKERKGT